MPLDTAQLASLKARLSEYDFTALVDMSGSMGQVDTPDNRTRWHIMQETARGFCRDMDQIDTDGITVIFFGGRGVKLYEHVTADKVDTLFLENSPGGNTPTAQAMRTALGVKTDKKRFIMVFTDGLPDKQAEVEDVIITQSNHQTRDDECTFLFVQVGHDTEASTWLRKIDDNLKSAKFDIVDAKTIDEAMKFGSTVELIAEAIED